MASSAFVSADKILHPILRLNQNTISFRSLFQISVLLFCISKQSFNTDKYRSNTYYLTINYLEICDEFDDKLIDYIN